MQKYAIKLLIKLTEKNNKMYNELTPKDIQKMQEEIDYRIAVIRPKISQDIIEAKAHRHFAPAALALSRLNASTT